MKSFIVASLLVASISALSECPTGWSEFQSKCYKIFEEKKSWDEAQDICRTEGSNLATIDSSNTNEFVEELLVRTPVEYPWIGAYLVSAELKEWKWIDGTPFEFENWDIDQPIHNPAEGCVEFVNGKWHDFPCDFPRAFICQKTNDCPDGWTEFQRKCYKFYGTKTSWNDANRDCERQGLVLASIKDKETNDFITGTLLKHIPDNTPYHQVYIGGRQIKEGGYTRDHWNWTDGSDFGYTNWMANPADGGNEDCMSMLLKNDALNVHGKWNDVHCGKDNWLPYICAFSTDGKPFTVVTFFGQISMGRAFMIDKIK